jgi:CRISPR/Cas system CMR-associated protein Cmr3 (group 5 of RAMP superfamily)
MIFNTSVKTYESNELPLPIEKIFNCQGSVHINSVYKKDELSRNKDLSNDTCFVYQNKGCRARFHEMDSQVPQYNNASANEDFYQLSD